MEGSLGEQSLLEGIGAMEKDRERIGGRRSETVNVFLGSGVGLEGGKVDGLEGGGAARPISFG